jgi:hypothetical protein
VLFWISVSMLTPLVLLIGPFNSRRRLLHDLILGTIIINSSVRTQVAQPARTFRGTLTRLLSGNRLFGKPIDRQPRGRDAAILPLLRSLTTSRDPALA